MGERLRKIPEQPLRGGVILFRQQAEIVAQREKLLEQLAGVITPADKNVGVAPVSYRSTNPLDMSLRSTASIVPLTRASTGGKKPTAGISSVLASNWSDP